MSAAQTSVRLSRHTRDEVNKLATERGLTADAAIAVAVQFLRWEERRQQGVIETREWVEDPAYLAEIASVLHDMEDDSDEPAA